MVHLEFGFDAPVVDFSVVVSTIQMLYDSIMNIPHLVGRQVDDGPIELVFRYNCLPTCPTLVAALEGCYRTAPGMLRLSPEREQTPKPE